MNLARYLEITQSASADWLASFRVQPVFDTVLSSSTQAASILLPTHHYAGEHPGVVEVREYLRKSFHPALASAWIYGSLAEEKACSYSDFDGILAIDAQQIKGRKSLTELKKILRATFRIMQQIDPLQHHGWSILPLHPSLSVKSEQCHPVLFAKASLLTANREIHSASFTPLKDPTQLLRQLIQTINRTAGTSENFYHFKWLLSQCLLIPAAYVQAITQRGEPKESSFAASRRLYTKAEWSFIEDCSSLRERWSEFYTPADRSKRFEWKENLPSELLHFFSGERKERMTILLNQLMRSLEQAENYQRE